MNLLPSQHDAANELQRRRAARAKMLPFVQYVKPEYAANWHHRVLCDHLDLFVSGAIQNLMVFMPPQHGKSELVSRKLPAFIFGKNPDTKIVVASFGASLIEGMNRDVQRTIDSPEYAKLFPDTYLNGSNVRSVSGGYLRNNEIFEIVGHGGQYKCAGVGGALTGVPGDIGIIDDPFKDYEEAKSKLVRDKVFEWYTSVFLARTHVRSRLLLTQTRWHEDDLAARLLDLEPGRWTVLSLPALCVDPNAQGERRQEGEALWPEKFPVSLLQGRRALNPHQFEALYQQNPSPREGSFFKVAMLGEPLPVAPAGLREVRAWDMAASEGSGAYTAGVRMGRDGNGGYVITDVKRGQWGPDTRNSAIKQTASTDGPKVKIRGPQDPGAAGKESALAFTRMLSEYTVKTVAVSGDKVTRADPFASQVNVGNVRLVKGPWNADFIEELRQFPNGKYKDQVDAAADAYTDLQTGGVIDVILY
jgi:predicted phage terminase large subunit-like protein